MFSVPGVALLVLLIYIKPQEFIPALEGLPLLYLCLALAVFGVALDLRLRLTRFDPPPHWPYIAAFVPWCLFTYLARVGGGGIVAPATDLVIVVCLFFILAIGIPTFQALGAAMAALMTAGLFVAAVCFHQGLSPLGCAVAQGTSVESLRADGRPCNKAEECYEGDAEPGAEYRCEKTGLFGTVSVGQGRVRYRGVLKDPNEVALATGVALPLLLARSELRATVGRYLLLVVGAGLIATTIIFTQSRGGILIFLTVVGAYFVKKFGLKGAVAGGLLGLPLLLLGGRDSGEADESAEERTEALAAAMQMLQSYPLTGVGYDQFTNAHYLTAHNSYALAFAELGLPGFVLFLAILYVSFKICFVALRRYAVGEEARVARVWAMAFLAALAGVAVGSFFLSFTYHQVLWIHLGLSGALYAVIRRHDAGFQVAISFTEKLLIPTAAAAFLVVMKVFLRYKGH